MRGKQAKKLRESAFIASSGFTPPSQKYLIYKKTGQIILNPNHPRAIYQRLKKGYKGNERI